MNTEPITNRCPKCQAPLPANAPQGLCPKCLLAAVSTPTEAGQPANNNPPPPIEVVARAFPQLEILELIGQGGMGVVYKARQPTLDRLVALKLLPQSLAADATFAERFNREARMLARLNHPNIVTVYDFGQSGGFFYLLMELVDGVNLRQAMQAGRFTPQQAMMLVPKICEALQFAHDEGILHRDIKPENILLDTRGRVKIADFGIAKLVGEAKEKVTLTASGLAIGTPHYMAPEQLEHPQDVDQRADIYSLGVVFYEMLTGELPIGRFAAPSTKSTADPRVDEVVFHALEREREKRFRSANEVKTSVEEITEHPAAHPAQSAPASALVQPGAGAAAHRAPCYFNTPKRMRNCFPSAAARIFTCRGELQLDGESLTFISTWRTAINIPLKDIEDLSVGQFQMWTTPWVIKYARINFLSVTFRRDGQLQTVHLTPVVPGATSASQINDCVGRWFELVRQAASQRAGTAPHASDTASVSVSAEPAWNRKAMLLVLGLILAGGASWLFKDEMGAVTILFSLMLVSIVLVVWLLWYSVGFLRANSALWRGALDVVTTEEPPAAELGFGPSRGVRLPRAYASSLVLMAAGFLALVELPWWGLRTWRFPASGENVLSSPSAPESEGQFVLYTMPSQGTDAPGVRRWKFKCLVPAHHLERLLFIFWTNGVPEVLNDFCAYYKVGNASIDQDFYISCARNTAADSPKGTNGVEWRVGPFAHVTGSAWFPGAPDYRHLKTPAHMTVRSGHQGILRLADYVTPEGQTNQGRSGVELRIFLEPITYAPVRIDPFEIEDAKYVAGRGPGWTPEEALKAIKQWPADPQPEPATPPSSAPAQVAAVSPPVAEAANDFVLYTMPLRRRPAPGELRWAFKCLIPAHHLARVLFVRWTNGGPVVDKKVSAFLKVGAASVDRDFNLACERPTENSSTKHTNDVIWAVDVIGRIAYTLYSSSPAEPAYHRLETPARMTVHSGHQGILRLVDYAGSDEQSGHGQSGIELRIFLEPMPYAPVRTDPFELEGANYVAGHGPGWTDAEVLKAIKEWPSD